jgi:hypothetical protein
MLAELGTMLDAYDVVRRAEELRKRRSEDEGLRFLAGFADLRAKLVRPVFESAGELLRARGHGFTVREEEFVFDGNGKTTEAMIAMRVTPAGMENAAASDVQRRELSLSTRHYNKTIVIVNGAAPPSGSMAGAGGGYTLAQVDAELVEEQLLKLVASLVRA